MPATKQTKRFESCLRNNIAAQIAEVPKRILPVAGIRSKSIYTPCFCNTPSVAPIAFDERGFRSSPWFTTPSNVLALASRNESELSRHCKQVQKSGWPLCATSSGLARLVRF